MKEVKTVYAKLKAVTMLEVGQGWIPGRLPDFIDIIRSQTTEVQDENVQALHSQGANSAWTWAVQHRSKECGW